MTEQLLPNPVDLETINLHQFGPTIVFDFLEPDYRKKNLQMNIASLGGPVSDFTSTRKIAPHEGKNMLAVATKLATSVDEVKKESLVRADYRRSEDRRDKRSQLANRLVQKTVDLLGVHGAEIKQRQSRDNFYQRVGSFGVAVSLSSRRALSTYDPFGKAPEVIPYLEIDIA